MKTYDYRTSGDFDQHEIEILEAYEEAIEPIEDKDQAQDVVECCYLHDGTLEEAVYDREGSLVFHVVIIL